MTGTKRSSMSGGLNVVSPFSSDRLTIRFSLNCDCRLRPNWSLDCARSVDCAPMAVGTWRASKSVSDTMPRLKNQSPPNTGRSPFSVFGLYGSYQRLPVRLSWSVSRQRSGTGIDSRGSSASGGGTCRGSISGIGGSIGLPIGRCTTMRSSGRLSAAACGGATGSDAGARGCASAPAGTPRARPGAASTEKFALVLPTT